MGLGSIGNIAKKLATAHPIVQVYKKRKKISKVARGAAKKYVKGYSKAGRTIYKGAKKVKSVIRNRHGNRSIKRMLKKKQRARKNKMTYNTYKLKESKREAYKK